MEANSVVLPSCMQLRSDTSVPLYVQIENMLTAQITSGELRPNDKLTSERDLSRALGISRMTVRHALHSLVQAGLLYTIPGKGIFVSERNAGLDVRVSLAGFSEDIRRTGARPSSVLMEACVQAATHELASALRIPLGQEVVKVERLRLVNQVPLALHTAFLPHNICPDLLVKYDLAVESLIEILAKEYHLRLSRAEQAVRAGLASPRELQLLRLSDPAPVLNAERTTYLETGAVVEVSRSTYCGEWYTLYFELDPHKVS
jgi:GntR family transcriptional regulator